MDYTTYLWFQYIDHKLDVILQQVTSPDPAKIKELKAHVDAKKTQLQKAIDANKPTEQTPDLTPPK